MSLNNRNNLFSQLYWALFSSSSLNDPLAQMYRLFVAINVIGLASLAVAWQNLEVNGPSNFLLFKSEASTVTEKEPLDCNDVVDYVISDKENHPEKADQVYQKCQASLAAIGL